MSRNLQRNMYFPALVFRWSGPWWTREKVGEYLPIFSRDHPPLLDYLRNIKILTGASQEGTDSGSHVAPWLKALLDRLRYLVSLVEPSILLWSIFSAGCAIITTSSTTGSTVTRRQAHFRFSLSFLGASVCTLVIILAGVPVF